MRADLHTHSIFSDGLLIPAELVRTAKTLGHDLIAITDHVDMTNVDFVVNNVIKAIELTDDSITVVPGVEITHVTPLKIASVVSKARELGAKIVVVHGETLTEPVEQGTNLVAASNPDVDILAHPGLATDDVFIAAKKNNVALEISGRAGHSLTNGHVVAMARKYGCKMVINSDTHTPDNLMTEEKARLVGKGAGMTDAEIDQAFKNQYDIVKRRC